MAIPEQITGAMYVMQRQIAELAGQQSSGVATNFPALQWNKVPVAMFSSWFSCFATDACCCTVEEEDFVAINAGLFDEAFGRNTRTPSTTEQNDQEPRRDPAHEPKDHCADEPCGSGLEKLSDGSMDEGDFLCGKRRGFGTCDLLRWSSLRGQRQE